MITISLCMIVKNEETTLAKCLESVCDIADEIVIADTGSTDATKAVARRFTNRVYDFTWIDDFSAARNFAFDKATMDYILWLDADDVLLEADRKKLLALKKTADGKTDVYMMKYNVGFDKAGGVTFSYYRERLARRSCGFRWREPVHEYLEFNGPVVSTDIAVTHTKQDSTPTSRNLGIYEKLLADGTPLSPRGVFYYARELFENGRFGDAIEYFQQFLATGMGWIEDNIRACYDLARCYREIGDGKSELGVLLKSFEYDAPRAETCCALGDYYFDLTDYKKAVVWYRIAAGLEEPTDSWGFVLHDCYGYIPHLQLCVCYDRLGDARLATWHNDMAARYKPGDSAVLFNKNYFKKANKR